MTKYQVERDRVWKLDGQTLYTTGKEKRPFTVEVVDKGVSFRPKSGNGKTPFTPTWDQIDCSYTYKREHPDTPLRPKHLDSISPRSTSYLVALLDAIDKQP